MREERKKSSVVVRLSKLLRSRSSTFGQSREWLQRVAKSNPRDTKDDWHDFSIVEKREFLSIRYRATAPYIYRG